MYDLHVPNEIYQREIGKLKQLAQQAADGKDSVSLCAYFFSSINAYNISFRINQRTRKNRNVILRLWKS